MIGLAILALALAILAAIVQTVAADGGAQGRHTFGVARGTDAQRTPFTRAEVTAA